jgi:hypothetical protein
MSFGYLFILVSEIFVKEKYYSLASSCESTLTVIFSHQEEDLNFMKNNVLHVLRVLGVLQAFEDFGVLGVHDVLGVLHQLRRSSTTKMQM